VNSEAQSVLMVLVGGAVLRISVGDVYLRYVKEGMRPFLLAAGVILLVLGLVGVWREFRAARRAAGAAAEHEGPDGDADRGHDHAHGPRAAWLLCLPVFAIFLVAPPALGSYAASREEATVARPAGTSDFPPLPAGDPARISVSEYAVRAVWDSGRSLAGRAVAMSGFVTPRKEGGWYLTPMALSCCAADARAVKVEVRDAEAPPTDTWVEVTGTWVEGGPPDAAGAVPVVAARDVRPVPVPRNQYDD
jgi:uncharacterized repeat protein (TIGR03943 family)